MPVTCCADIRVGFALVPDAANLHGACREGRGASQLACEDMLHALGCTTRYKFMKRFVVRSGDAQMIKTGMCPSFEDEPAWWVFRTVAEAVIAYMTCIVFMRIWQETVLVCTVDSPRRLCAAR